MSEVRPPYDDEIDLVELFSTLWDGKWKIFGVASVAIFGSFLFQVVQGPPSFVATTEIRPISTAQAELYKVSNDIGVFEVAPQSLLHLYVEALEDRNAIEFVVRELNLISPLNFKNTDDFEDAVNAFVSSIEILLKTGSENTNSNSNLLGATLKAEFNDERRWREALILLNSQITAEVQVVLQEIFQNTLRAAQQERAFLLEDFELRAESLIANYNRFTSDRLAFLREQAEIARELNVATNTLEVQTFNAQTSMIAAVNTDMPFYLRGYEAIEKEIQLIESRQDATAFVEGLRAVEQEKRDIIQDRTLERAESLWSLTPAATQEGFSAASMRIAETSFDVKQNRMLVFALADIIGAFVGIIYVLVSNAMRKRKEKLASS
jgi:LPS O-antigen subunit length determinant protein (WzzB/FepE family)